MEMNKVEASNIAAFGYDEDSQTLEVKFNKKGSPINGDTFQYFDVPLEIFNGMLGVKSESGSTLGQYLYKHVKGKYRFSQVYPAISEKLASSEFRP